MATIYNILKSQALKRLPDSWLGALKARHYLKMLKKFNIDDEPDMKIIPFLVSPGSIAVDLGANVGVYTKLLSEHVGAAGQVLSVEPVPQTFAILRENVRRLGLMNVTLIDAAVSDSVGVATMSVPEYATGGQNFYESSIVSDLRANTNAGACRVNVRTTTLDTVAAGRSLSFIKCDVEGHEGAVIAGASQVLQSGGRPAWLIEISENPDTPGTSAAAVFGRLASHGYSVWLFDGSHLRQRKPGDRSANYFFLFADHIAAIQSLTPALMR